MSILVDIGKKIELIVISIKIKEKVEIQKLKFELR